MILDVPVLCFAVCVAISCQPKMSPPPEKEVFKKAAANGRAAAEGFERNHRYLTGWLAMADPECGLIPRNLKKDRDIWNPRDSAADNYPFMVLCAAVLDRPLFEGAMLEMLRKEIRLTSRIGRLPDAYSFSKKGFRDETPDLDRIVFGASEYIKDGLLPVTEWIGQSPWTTRMLDLLDDLWKRAPIETSFGRILSESHEINGEMLQVLSRVYWMTGKKKYLEWALRLGDYYLLGGRHPTESGERLRLRDHGCEIVSGLCELYATVHFARPDKRTAYQRPLHTMLARILEVGRNEHGLFYNTIDPKTGEHESGRGGRSDVADTWGYTLNGYWTVYMIDKTPEYRDAVEKALGNLDRHYRNFPWEGESADGYADAIEGALNLYNRLPVRSAARWIDSEIKVMWKKQRPDGVIEGWHGDGNFARTTLMYCLWKTKGVTIRPWREDVVFGAVQEGDTLNISIRAEAAWNGKILIDAPRHKTVMNLPMDWPRINQFPEWFTVEPDQKYLLNDLTKSFKRTYSGRQLTRGVPLKLEALVEHHLVVK